MKNGLITDGAGNKKYFVNNKLHSKDNAPSMIFICGQKTWHNHGKLHNEHGHAVEYADGSKFWWLNGEQHRVDGPGEIWANGTKCWYLHGKLHRVDGPAEEYADGSKFWWLHDKLHRVDGPAAEEADGSKSWWLNGNQLVHPVELQTTEAWFEKLNTDEEYSLPFINNINGLFGFIKNPTDKQKRLHAMKWKI